MKKTQRISDVEDIVELGKSPQINNDYEIRRNAKGAMMKGATPIDLLPTTPSEDLIDEMNPIEDPIDSSFKIKEVEGSII